MYEQKCPNCGANKIVFENGHFKCVFCDAVFTDSTADRAEIWIVHTKSQ